MDTIATIVKFLKILGSFLLYFKLAGFIDWSWAAVLTPFIIIGIGRSFDVICEVAVALVLFFGWLISTIAGFLMIVVVETPYEARKVFRKMQRKLKRQR